MAAHPRQRMCVMLLIIAASSLVVGAYSQIHPTHQPWLDRCDDAGISRVHAPSAYYVLNVNFTEKTSSSWLSFIISLCNLTEQTPERNTSVCPDSTSYFVSVWNSNGTCISSYNEVLGIEGNGTVGSPLTIQFRSNGTNKKLALQMECNPSQVQAAIVGVDQLTPTMMTVEGQVSDLCPPKPPSPPGSGSSSTGDHRTPPEPDNLNSHRTVIAVFVVIAVIGAIAGAVLYRRRQISRHVPYHPIAQDADGAGFEANNVQSDE